MAYQHNTLGRPTASSSSSAFMPTKHQDHTSESASSFASFGSTPTFYHRNMESYETPFLQDNQSADEDWESYAGTQSTKRSMAGIEEAHTLVAHDQQYEGGMLSDNERLYHANTYFTGNNSVIQGFSDDAAQSSPLPARSEPELPSERMSLRFDTDGQDSQGVESPGHAGLEEACGIYNHTCHQGNQAEAEIAWFRPSRCLLGGCRSGIIFPTWQSWSSHCKNVHNKTFFCAVLGCYLKTPFANKTDLKRHHDAKHNPTKPFRCERPQCDRKVKAWSRKDKLKLHNKTYHSNFRCFFCSQTPGHERWFDTKSEVFLHTTQTHRTI